MRVVFKGTSKVSLASLAVVIGIALQFLFNHFHKSHSIEWPNPLPMRGLQIRSCDKVCLRFSHACSVVNSKSDRSLDRKDCNIAAMILRP